MPLWPPTFMGQLNVPKTKVCQSKDTITSFDCAKFHWNPSACGRDFGRDVSQKWRHFMRFLMGNHVFEDSWNHRRITPGSLWELLEVPRGSSTFQNSSNLLESQIMKKDDLTSPVTYFWHHFPEFPCAGCTMGRHETSKALSFSLSCSRAAQYGAKHSPSQPGGQNLGSRKPQWHRPLWTSTFMGQLNVTKTKVC